MPVLVPIAIAGASYFGASVAVGAMITAGMVTASSIGAAVAGVVVGAVIGAAVGAIGSLVTGGDIGEGALWGAVGGAVAGGFAGFNAAGATANTSISASTGHGVVDSSGAAIETSGAAASEAGKGLLGMSDGAGALLGAGVSTAGSALVGLAQGEAAGDQQAESQYYQDQVRSDTFEKSMATIREEHNNRMAELGLQGDNSLALADKNNDAAMDQLNARIHADKDAVAAANGREDELSNRFNDSIVGTNKKLFDRPNLDFSEANQQDIAFNSGFDEAVATKSGELTPEQLAELEQQQAKA